MVGVCKNMCDEGYFEDTKNFGFCRKCKDECTKCRAINVCSDCKSNAYILGKFSYFFKL